MNLSRRSMLATAGGVAATSMAPIATMARGTPSDNARGDNPLVHRALIGDIEVVAVGDGYLGIDAKMLPTADAEDVRSLLQQAFLPTGPVRTFINTFVVIRGGTRVLIDAGLGAGIAESTGHLLSNLATAGFSPGSISSILLTHMHRDHVRGITDANGVALFPNADILVHEAELAYWTSEAEEAKAPEIAKPHFGIARAALKPYAGRVHTFSKSGEVLENIRAVHAPGHTPGHTLFRIASGDASLLIAGDIVHLPALQFPRPEWSIALDLDLAAAAETRRRVLDAAAEARELLAGMHFTFPTFGHVKRTQQGYQFVPAPWQTRLPS